MTSLQFILALYLIVVNPLFLLVAFPYGLVVWGVLTLVGFKLLTYDWKDRAKRRPFEGVEKARKRVLSRH